MKRLQQASSAVLLLAAAVFTGCASTGPPLPPSLELPKPVSDLRAVRKGDKVYLAWTVPTETTDRGGIRHPGPTRVCRTPQTVMQGCGVPVGELPSTVPAAPGQSPKAAAKVPASYVDELPPQLTQENPAGFLTYAVEVLNASQRSAGLSNQVQAPATPTLPPPDNFQAKVTAAGVELSWSGVLHEHEIPGMRHFYRVYRRPEDSQASTVVGEVTLSTSAEGELLDRSSEWEKTYYYRATVVTVIPQPGKPEIQVEGEDTPEIKVFVHDIFPPAVPSGLQAVFSGAGQPAFVDLIWAPVTNADLAGYNLYRHEPGAQPVKINADLIQAPAYRDTNVQLGKRYLYSVTSVDLRGNEGAHSEEAGERVPESSD